MKNSIIINQDSQYKEVSKIQIKDYLKELKICLINKFQ